MLAATLFVAALAVLVIRSVSTDPPPGHPVSDLSAQPEPAGLISNRTLTLDARAAERWTRLDLSRATLTGDQAGWDLAVRRFRLIVNGGSGFEGEAGVIALERDYGSVTEAPADGYVGSEISTGGDSTPSRRGPGGSPGTATRTAGPRRTRLPLAPTPAIQMTWAG